MPSERGTLPKMPTLALLTAALLLQSAQLQVTDTKIGKGAEAKPGDVLTMLYKGTLDNGKVFDSNAEEGKQPLAFKLGAGQVIKGWDEGLKGMKVGGSRHLVIPSAMAYGPKGIGDIPGDATLTFDVTLIRIDKKGAKQKIEIEETAAGTGPEIKKGDNVDVHYKGTFINGTKFDSSYDRNEPFNITVGTTRLIKGFTEGVTGMKVGGKRKVTIPYTLAYGDAGRPPVIPPYSTLVFELEVVAKK